MESEEGISIENGPDFDHVEESVTDSKEEVQNIENKNVLNVRGILAPESTDEDPNVSEVEVDAPVTVTESKSSKSSKEPRARTNVSLKHNKVVKDQPNFKGPAQLPRKQRSLSQTLSFPARGLHADGTKKNIDSHPVKGDSKNGRSNGSQLPVPNGSISSVRNLTHPNNRRATTVRNASEAHINSGGASIRRATIASVSKTQQPESGKSGPMHAMENNPSSVVSLSSEQNPKPLKNILLIKEDDDVRSTSSSTSRGQVRVSTSGFSFRLDERAERRKEFFSKLEEKINAEEAEKSNVQEKSKENQEAEIKRLRKSLTFKATPMPTFYKEPPQKPELKKIPTTRPISPKLGRNKNITAASKPSLENGASSASPRFSRDKGKSFMGIQPNSDKVLVGPKKVLKKSQSKLQTHETTAAETEQKPIEAETENQNLTLSPSEQNDNADESDHLLKSANPEIVSSEVGVEG